MEYKKLEDEFRDALKIEERRYQEVIPFSRISPHPCFSPVIQNQRDPPERERTSPIRFHKHQTARRIRSKDGQRFNGGKSSASFFSRPSPLDFE